MRSGSKGLLDFKGRRGITSVVRWNLRSVMLSVEVGVCKSFAVKVHAATFDCKSVWNYLAVAFELAVAMPLG